jgi:hypothetical protein
MKRAIKVGLGLLISLFSVTTAKGQQDFDLVEPTGQVTATAQLGRGRLLVHGQKGQRVFFSRDAHYDSADGRFVGYFSHAIDRALRFPRSGTGMMQTASLRDPQPRFRNTRRAVRPRRGQVGAPLLASVPVFHGQWMGPQTDPFLFGSPLLWRRPQSILLESTFIPNAPLPPASLQLLNDGRRELQVGIQVLENSSARRTLRIRPSSTAEIELARDSGGKRIEHYRVITPYGYAVTREIITEVQPAIRYELVVHEWAMQSIAIDRTGKSPNVIEDINFQGRGIGRFFLPPGPALQSGVIGVYSAAMRQRNAGAVPPIVPEKDLPVDGFGGRALEDAVLEAQRAAQRRAAGN